MTNSRIGGGDRTDGEIGGRALARVSGAFVGSLPALSVDANSREGERGGDFRNSDEPKFE